MNSAPDQEIEYQAGTRPLRRRSCLMGRQVTSTRIASLWRKLANALALLTIAIFVTHAVAAEGALLHAHDRTASHAAPSLIANDNPVGSSRCHGDSSAVSQKQSSAGDEAPPCCGKACLTAVMPRENPHPDRTWAARSESLVPVSSLDGRDPEGPRRPPRRASVI